MHIPVVVGVGDIRNLSHEIKDAKEPATLMLEAIRAALVDTGIQSEEIFKLQSAVDSINVVRTWTWPYEDLPGLLASQLQVQPKHKCYSEHGGANPAKLFDLAARQLAQGQSQVAVVTGGEALASLTDCVRAKISPPGWTEPSQPVTSVFSPTTRSLGDHVGARHQFGNPIQIYPLYEAGFRAHRKQGLDENHDESVQLYAEFAEIAAQNPSSWNYGRPVQSAEEIGKITRKNRMICSPYPLLMNAFNTVNMAAACILTTVDFATKLGIPQSKWIYPLGGAGTTDHVQFWDRTNFHSSPALSQSLDAALKISKLSTEDVDFYDFYSCFPIVPKLACAHLGLPLTDHTHKPVSLLGGLTSFGGAGNNYSLHAITAAVRRLRSGQGQNGLILANGGVLTYHYVVCLSSRVPQHAYPERNPLPAQLQPASPKFQDQAHGPSIIETYTVEFARDGEPLRACIVGRLKSNDARFLSNHADESTLRYLAFSRQEQIGKSGRVRTDVDGRNLFSLDVSTL